MLLEWSGRPFAHGTTPNRDTRRMHRFWIPRNQGVPPSQIAALRQPTIRTARRQPVDFLKRLRAQVNAIGNVLPPVLVVAAPAGGQVQQAARHIGKCQVTSVFISKLVKAATAATVAE